MMKDIFRRCLFLGLGIATAAHVTLAGSSSAALRGAGIGGTEPNSGSDGIPELPGKTPVATVNGTVIPFDAIKVDPNELTLFQPAMKEDILMRRVKERELQKLAARIHIIVADQKLRDMGITASDEEVRARVDASFRTVGWTSDANIAPMRKQWDALRTALAKVIADPNAADDLYREYLQPVGVSKDQWRALRFSYGTPEKFKKLKFPANLEEMKANSIQSAKGDVLHEKLDERITANVKVSDEDVRSAYQKEYGGSSNAPPFDEVKDRIRAKLLQAKQNEEKARWWREQYKSADIEIKDPAFRGVMDLLLGYPSSDSAPSVQRAN